MQPPDRLDEDKERAASWCEEHQRMEDSEAHDLARLDEYEGQALLEEERK